MLLTALAAAQESPQAPTFSAQVELVTVDVVVLDGKGQLVRGLSREDFTLLEDGKPQPIASFEAFDLGADEEERAPRATLGPVATNVAPPRAAARVFVLLVDDMGLPPARASDVRAALARFVSEGLHNGDELIFTTSSRDTWWSARIPEGREDLLALVARIQGRNLLDRGSDYVSEWEAFRISSYEGIVGSEDGPGAAQGPPTGQQAAVARAPGSNLTQRVFERFMARGVCVPLAAGLCYSHVRARAQEVDQRRRNRTRDIVAAVDRATVALTGIRGRKSLLLLSEGFLNDPDVKAVQEVAGRCREANLAVYSLDIRGLIAGLDQMSAAEAGVPNTAELGIMQMEQTDFVSAGSEALAEDTGGFAVKNTNDLAGGASRVADESRVYYLLGYTPPEGKGPRDWRKLKVEVKRSGLNVRARKGYTLRSPEEMAAATSPKAKDKPRAKKTVAGAEATAPPVPLDVARALSTAHDASDVPLRAMAYVLDARPGGVARVLIAVEADLRSLANLGGDEHPRAVLSFSIAATHRDSGKTQRLDQRLEVDAGRGGAFERWLASSRELELPAGVAQARVVVRDEFLGRLGAVTLRIVVPELSGLRLSTPVLTDRVAKGREDGPPQPVLLARREFAPEGRLYCQFQVFGAASTSGAAPQVEASYELRRRHGEVMRRGSPSLIQPGPDGRLVRLLGLPLDGMAEGDYDLVLRIEDKTTGETRERLEPLRLLAPRG